MNGWMGGLQKLITVLGRFVTYNGGVYGLVFDQNLWSIAMLRML